ncbi:MAG: TIGR03750 family conjugal transfer protein [Alteromonadaceae bacterium]|nr:TIGR03750 family conjugal transfer protein [Alteromonadaceae bacterium]
MMSQDESEFTDNFTGDFINEEPVVFKGLTDSEVKSVFLISLVTGTPFGVAVGLFIGIPMLIVVFVLLFPIITVYFTARWLEKARRGKPPGYVEQLLHIKLSEKKIVSADFIFDSYHWGLGRTSKKDRDANK